MKALILAAGRGDRMRPLTDRTPKPLLAVRGKRLIEWHLEALARAGVRDVVINTAWLEEQFPQVLGDGSRYGVAIEYSMEGRDHGGALETAGGMLKALPRLGDTFWVVSGDVFVPGFDFTAPALEARLAQLWLVPNPPHHPRGDFGIDADGLARSDHEPRYTWSSIGVFSARFVRELMQGLSPGTKAPLRPYLEAAIARRALGAALWRGAWTDVGTPERLAALNASTA
jgi:MurNAc alpha-1-phosphate uridylyltransferase